VKAKVYTWKYSFAQMITHGEIAPILQVHSSGIVVGGSLPPYGNQEAIFKIAYRALCMTEAAVIFIIKRQLTIRTGLKHGI
jgi:hypothetical protein